MPEERRLPIRYFAALSLFISVSYGVKEPEVENGYLQRARGTEWRPLTSPSGDDYAEEQEDEENSHTSDSSADTLFGKQVLETLEDEGVLDPIASLPDHFRTSLQDLLIKAALVNGESSPSKSWGRSALNDAFVLAATDSHSAEGNSEHRQHKGSRQRSAGREKPKARRKVRKHAGSNRGKHEEEDDSLPSPSVPGSADASWIPGEGRPDQAALMAPPSAEYADFTTTLRPADAFAPPAEVQPDQAEEAEQDVVEQQPFQATIPTEAAHYPIPSYAPVLVPDFSPMLRDAIVPVAQPRTIPTVPLQSYDEAVKRLGGPRIPAPQLLPPLPTGAPQLSHPIPQPILPRSSVFSLAAKKGRQMRLAAEKALAAPFQQPLKFFKLLSSTESKDTAPVDAGANAVGQAAAASQAKPTEAAVGSAAQPSVVTSLRGNGASSRGAVNHAPENATQPRPESPVRGLPAPTRDGAGAAERDPKSDLQVKPVRFREKRRRGGWRKLPRKKGRAKGKARLKVSPQKREHVDNTDSAPRPKASHRKKDHLDDSGSAPQSKSSFLKRDHVDDTESAPRPKASHRKKDHLDDSGSAPQSKSSLLKRDHVDDTESAPRPKADGKTTHAENTAQLLNGASVPSDEERVSHRQQQEKHKNRRFGKDDRQSNSDERAHHRQQQERHNDHRSGKADAKKTHAEDAVQLLNSASGERSPASAAAALAEATSAPAAPAATAPAVAAPAALSEDGYRSVVALASNEAMEAYVHRVINSLGFALRPGTEAQLHGFVPFYSGLAASQTFARLQAELAQVPWLEKQRETAKITALAENNAYVCEEPSSNCEGAVRWAMEHGFDKNPTWYPGLSKKSTFFDFQMYFARNHDAGCQCQPEDAASKSKAQPLQPVATQDQPPSPQKPLEVLTSETSERSPKMVWINAFARSGSSAMLSLLELIGPTEDVGKKKISLLEEGTYETTTNREFATAEDTADRDATGTASKVLALFEPCHERNDLNDALQSQGCVGLMHQLLRCNFTGVRKLKHWEHERSRTGGEARYTESYAGRQCHDSDVVLIKTINVTGALQTWKGADHVPLNRALPELVGPELQASERLRVVDIVRDPRAIYASWVRIPAFQSMIQRDSSTLLAICDVLIRGSSLKHPRMTRVLYEDFVANPKKVAKHLYKFLGMHFGVKQSRWIDANFNATCEKSGFFHDCHSDSSAPVRRWRKVLTEDEVHAFATHHSCKKVAETYGYPLQ